MKQASEEAFPNRDVAVAALPQGFRPRNGYYALMVYTNSIGYRQPGLVRIDKSGQIFVCPLAGSDMSKALFASFFIFCLAQ